MPLDKLAKIASEEELVFLKEIDTLVTNALYFQAYKRISNVMNSSMIMGGDPINGEFKSNINICRPVIAEIWSCYLATELAPHLTPLTRYELWSISIQALVSLGRWPEGEITCVQEYNQIRANLGLGAQQSNLVSRAAKEETNLAYIYTLSLLLSILVNCPYEQDTTASVSSAETKLSRCREIAHELEDAVVNYSPGGVNTRASTAITNFSLAGFHLINGNRDLYLSSCQKVLESIKPSESMIKTFRCLSLLTRNVNSTEMLKAWLLNEDRYEYGYRSRVIEKLSKVEAHVIHCGDVDSSSFGRNSTEYAKTLETLVALLSIFDSGSVPEFYRIHDQLRCIFTSDELEFLSRKIHICGLWVHLSSKAISNSMMILPVEDLNPHKSEQFDTESLLLSVMQAGILEGSFFLGRDERTYLRVKRVKPLPIFGDAQIKELKVSLLSWRERETRNGQMAINV